MRKNARGLLKQRTLTNGHAMHESASTPRRSRYRQQEKEAYEVQRSDNFNAELRARVYRQLLLARSPVQPSDVVQTVNASVLIEGVGLNSGMHERILIMPAAADEGRYFVRVPPLSSSERAAAADGSYLEPTLMNEEQQEGLALEELRESLMDEEDRAAVYQRMQNERNGQLPENLDNSSIPSSRRRSIGGQVTPKQRSIATHGAGGANEGNEDENLEEAVLSDDSATSDGNEEKEVDGDASSPVDPRRKLPLRERPTEEEFEGYEEEERIYAVLTNVVSATTAGVELGNDQAGSTNNVRSVERLLAALEACGIDAARIEVEGNGEVPFVDGACEHFIASLSQVGCAPAVSYDGHHVKRLAPTPTEPLFIPSPNSETGGFVAIFPDILQRIAAGVDMHESTNAIGRQWSTFVPSQDEPFFDCIAPARKLVTQADMDALRAEGGMLGGRSAGLLVCDTDKLLNPPERFHREEVARSEISHVYGIFALAACNCVAGVPNAHVIAFNASFDMLIDAAAELAQQSLGIQEFNAALHQRLHEEDGGRPVEEVEEELLSEEEIGKPPTELTPAWHPPLLGPDAK